jgi:hypothetical protein
VGAVRSATSVLVLPITANAVPALMASATAAANTLIKTRMRAPALMSHHLMKRAQIRF